MTAVSTHTLPDGSAPPPWYKQFWPWFLIALPASAVVGCAFTIYLAVTNQDFLVTDDYYRVGVTINSALAEMDRAEELGVTARIAPVEGQQLLLQLPPTAATAPQSLELLFRHPTQPDNDFAINLVSQGEQNYRGTLPQAIDGRWMVVLSPAAGQSTPWRLEATWHQPRQQALLLGRSPAPQR